MKRIVDYRVIRRLKYDLEYLEKTVCLFIDYGWQPIGGIAIDKDGAQYQALVKYEGVEA